MHFDDEYFLYIRLEMRRKVIHPLAINTFYRGGFNLDERIKGTIGRSNEFVLCRGKANKLSGMTRDRRIVIYRHGR